MGRPYLATGWLLVSLLAAPAHATSGDDDDVDISVPAKPAPPPAVAPPPAASAPVAPPPASPAALPAAASAPVAPPAEPPPAPAPAPPSIDPGLQSQIDSLRQQLADMERRLAAVPPATAAHIPSTNPAASATINPDAVRQPGVALLGNLRLTGYVQVQYQHTDVSEDQLSPTGASLNQDLFLVRRARLRLAGDWTFFSFMVEADGNTVNGPTVGLTRAEASLFWRKDALTIPYIKGTLGLTAMPFGFELQQPENELMFMERSTASRAFFPLKQDVGAVLAGGLGIFRYQVAAMGSESSAYPNSPTPNPDFLGRVGIEQTNPDFVIAGGVSFLDGSGFSPGTSATKNTLEWIDTNENGVVDPGEIIGVPGAAARPSSTFNHWGLNVDLEVGFRTPAGWTRIYGEGTLAENLDRALFIADPTTFGRNLREVAFLGGITQDITKYGFIGFRADGYNPDLDSTLAERGLVLVTSQTITTLAPIIGLALPGRARLTFEYDYVINLLGRTSSGVPTQLDDNDWIIRLQGEL